MDILSFVSMDKSLNSDGSVLVPYPFLMVDCICGQLPFGESVRKKSGIPLCSVIATKSNPKDFQYCFEPGIEHGTAVPYAAYGSCTSLFAFLNSPAVIFFPIYSPLLSFLHCKHAF